MKTRAYRHRDGDGRRRQGSAGDLGANVFTAVDEYGMKIRQGAGKPAEASRLQNVPTLDRKQFAPAEGLRRGAYILADAPQAKPRLIMIASGSEVGLIVAAAQKLQEQNILVRLVSMPSWELFEAQSQGYRDSVLPPSVPARLAVEAGVSQGWRRYVGDGGDVIGVDRFGASAPGPVVMREYGFSVENVCRRALALLARNAL